MTTMTFVEPSGQRVDVDVPDGWNLMQAAVANGVDGIVGECGGSCACATCHCYVDDPRAAELAQPGATELAMLDNVAAPRRHGSRLACQIKAAPELAGLVLVLPETQE